MAINQGLIMELKHEAANTRKMLERIPTDKYTWKPHEKSAELLRLSAHLAMNPIWIGRALDANEFDFANVPKSGPAATNREEVLSVFDKNIEAVFRARPFIEANFESIATRNFPQGVLT